MHLQRWILVAALALAAGYVWLRGGFIGILEINPAPAAAIAATAQAEPQGQGQAVATFASGCFWCTEADFERFAASYPRHPATPAEQL